MNILTSLRLALGNNNAAVFRVSPECTIAGSSCCWDPDWRRCCLDCPRNRPTPIKFCPRTFVSELCRRTVSTATAHFYCDHKQWTKLVLRHEISIFIINTLVAKQTSCSIWPKMSDWVHQQQSVYRGQRSSFYSTGSLFATAAVATWWLFDRMQK